jgi:hypothetical protein
LRDLREIRLLADYQGTMRRICKLTFSPAESSLNIVPFVKQGKFFYGGKMLPETQSKAIFRLDNDLISDQEAPRLSIHQSGQIRVCVGKDQAGPLFSTPLKDLCGEHIVSVCIDRFADMPIYDKTIQNSGSRIDQVISVGNKVESARLVIYLNGEKPVFFAKCTLKVSLFRPGSQNPLFIGIMPIAQEKFGNDEGGITVIAGWNREKEDEFEDYLYLRGQ